MKKLPPKTKRYCNICKEITTYKYDNFIGHSFCIKCGRSSLYSKKPKEVKMKEQWNQILTEEDIKKIVKKENKKEKKNERFISK